jgi:pimeloyl-ACP methyl ester carboxylesterase
MPFMLTALAQLLDTIPTHWRVQKTRSGVALGTRNDIRFVDLGNTIIRMRQAGLQGPSIVFAADPPVPLELYDDLISILSNRYRVTVFEMPGFGCSLPRIQHRFSMDAAVATVTRLLEQLPGGPHVLALPCVTGFISLGIARARPDLVASLILLQTPNWQGAQQWLHGRDPKHLLRTPFIGQIALATMRRKRIRQWYAGALADKSKIESFSQATLNSFDHGACFCLASGFQDFLQDHGDHVAPVNLDTLIIWGGRDPSHKLTDVQLTRELAPNSHSILFDDVGHFPELEATERFSKALDEFLSSTNR